jgi:hypothetical protein
MTDMMSSAMMEEARLEDTDIDTIKNDYRINIPTNRFATGKDIGNVVAFPSSDEEKYLTGVSIFCVWR